MQLQLANRIALLLVAVLVLTYTGRCLCCVIAGTFPTPGFLVAAHQGHVHLAAAPASAPDGTAPICWDARTSSPLAAEDVGHFQDFVVLLLAVGLISTALLRVARRSDLRPPARGPAPPAPPPRIALAGAF